MGHCPYNSFSVEAKRKKKMTDSKMFTTTVVIKQLGLVKVFIGFNHRARALTWLAAH